MASTSLPGRLRAVPEDPRCWPAFPVPEMWWCRTAVPGDSCLVQGTRGRQLSRATRLRIRVPAGLTSCPGQLGIVPKASRGLPDIPGNSGMCPRDLGVDQLSQEIRAPALSARGADQLCWETRNLVGGPVGSTSCPRHLALVSEGPSVYHCSWATRVRVRKPGFRIAVPGVSRLCPRFHGVYQLSRATWAWV